MEKKQRRNSGKPATTEGNRVSFLSVRNIWIDPSAASSVLERNRPEIGNSAIFRNQEHPSQLPSRIQQTTSA